MNLEIQGLVDGLAERVRQPVGVDDRRYRAIAYSSHGNDVDPVRRASILGREAPAEVTAWLDTLGLTRANDYVRVPKRPQFEMLARVCFPIRFQDRVLGFLWLVDDNPALTDQNLDTARTFVPELAESLFRLQQQRGDELQRERRAVHALMDGTDVATPELANAPAYAVAVLAVNESSGSTAREQKSVEARLLQGLAAARRLVSPRHQIASVDAGLATVVLAAGATDELVSSIEQIRETTSRQLQDMEAARLLIGVGTTATAREGITESFHRANLSLRVARLLGITTKATWWDDLGADGLIVELLADREPGDLVPAALRRLLELTDGPSLLATLSVYLEHAGHVPEASAALFVHRSSLYHRIHRIEEITGLDLRSGAARLELHIGLRLLRLAGEIPQPDGREDPVRLIS